MLSSLRHQSGDLRPPASQLLPCAEPSVLESIAKGDGSRILEVFALDTAKTRARALGETPSRHAHDLR
jgi:hypothetical protein